jgi:hypothetical protein
MEVKLDLDSQVQQRRQGITNQSQLSTVETKLNQSLIRTVTDNPALLERVIEKLHPAGSKVTSSTNVF